MRKEWCLPYVIDTSGNYSTCTGYGQPERYKQHIITDMEIKIISYICHIVRILTSTMNANSFHHDSRYTKNFFTAFIRIYVLNK